MGDYHPILMKICTQTKKYMLRSKITKAEVQAKFQDGRCRRVGNSSACYKMGNYYPIFTQSSTQTEKNMLSSKFIFPGVKADFQDDRRRPFGN
jgi:hypothetical protein